MAHDDMISVFFDNINIFDLSIRAPDAIPKITKSDYNDLSVFEGISCLLFLAVLISAATKLFVLIFRWISCGLIMNSQ